MKTLMTLLTVAIIATLTATAQAATAKNTEIVKLAGPNPGIAVVPVDNPATITPAADWNADTNIGLTSTAFAEPNAPTAFTGTPAFTVVQPKAGTSNAQAVRAGYGTYGVSANNRLTVETVKRTAVTPTA